MSKRVYIFLDEDMSGAEIAVPENGGITLHRFDISSISSGNEVIAFVPSTEVSCHRVKLSAAKASELYRVAPYSIEDELAVPVEDLHFALGPRAADGYVEIFAVSHEKMAIWTKWLKQNGIKNAKLIPDASVIHQDGVMMAAGDRILARIEGRPLAIDWSSSDDALNALSAHARSGLHIFGKELASRLERTEENKQDFPPLALLAQWAEQVRDLVDLKQGAYAGRRQSSLNTKAMKIPALVSAIAAILFIGTILGENRAQNMLRHALEEQAKVIFEKKNPGRSIPSDLSALQNQSLLADTDNTIDFLNAAAALYANLPDDSGYAIRAMRYDQRDGKLTASITYPDYGADTDLKRKLEALGLSVSIGDARQQNGRVFGDITLEAPK